MNSAISRYAIRLEGIRFRARHGASDAELELPQDFVAELEVSLPVDRLPSRDERASVYDYDVLSNLVVEEGTRSSYRLLESLASRLVDRLFADTPALAVTVRLRKFGPPTTASVDAAAIELSATRPSR